MGYNLVKCEWKDWQALPTTLDIEAQIQLHQHHENTHFPVWPSDSIPDGFKSSDPKSDDMDLGPYPAPVHFCNKWGNKI